MQPRNLAFTAAAQARSNSTLRAGPRPLLHFQPTEVVAAIVTCGGLCPGLNNVIREITHSLYYLYGANKVYGITGGFHGFYKDDYQPILLTNELVENIHHDGGTVLRSSRGGFDMQKILQFLLLILKHNLQNFWFFSFIFQDNTSNFTNLLIWFE